MKNVSQNLRKTSATFALVLLSLFGLQSCSDSKAEPSPNPISPKMTASFLLDSSDGTSALCMLPESSNRTLETSTKTVTEEPDTTTMDGVSIDRSSLCTLIENHEPQNKAMLFSQSEDKVYFFTEVKMPKGQSSTVNHIWFYKGKEISRVSLEVKGPSFRTWSYKSINEKLTGEWKVEAHDLAGKVIDSMEFTVE